MITIDCSVTTGTTYLHCHAIIDRARRTGLEACIPIERVPFHWYGCMQWYEEELGVWCLRADISSNLHCCLIEFVNIDINVMYYFTYCCSSVYILCTYLFYSLLLFREKWYEQPTSTSYILWNNSFTILCLCHSKSSIVIWIIDVIVCLYHRLLRHIRIRSYRIVPSPFDCWVQRVKLRITFDFTNQSNPNETYHTRIRSILWYMRSHNAQGSYQKK